MTSSGAAVREPVRRRPARRVNHVLRVGAYALPLAVAALVSRPQLFGLSDVTGFLHLVAFPAVRGIAWSFVAVALAGVVLFARRRYLVWLLLIALLAAGFDLATTAVRGVGGPLPPPAPGDLSVVTVNTLNETVSPEEVGELLVEERAAVVAMPETGRTFAIEVAAYVAQRGMRMQVFGGVPRERAWPSVTSLLVSKGLGRYEPVARAEPALDAVAAAPARGDGPTVAAVHSPPPFVSVSAPRAWEGIWREGASDAAALCRQRRADIVLGDVNATLDHEPLADLGGCVDAAAESGAGAEGTWPASVPAVLAAPIDHVFVHRSAWLVLGTEARVLGGSDHRALVARLRHR